MEPKYKRVLLKLSGEALAGDGHVGIDYDNTVLSICRSIKECVDLGVEVAIVVGGGNFWRGRSSGSMDRTRADHMGMLATVINALADYDCHFHTQIHTFLDGSADGKHCIVVINSHMTITGQGFAAQFEQDSLVFGLHTCHSYRFITWRTLPRYYPYFTLIRHCCKEHFTVRTAVLTAHSGHIPVYYIIFPG